MHHWIYEVTEISGMAHVFPFHLISVKHLRPVFPLLAPGSPGHEGRCWRAGTSRSDGELFFTLPLLCWSSVICVAALVVPQKVSQGYAVKQKSGCVLHVVSIPLPGFSLQACAVQSGLGLMTERASSSWAGTGLASECLFPFRAPCIFSPNILENNTNPFSHTRS